MAFADQQLCQVLSSDICDDLRVSHASIEHTYRCFLQAQVYPRRSASSYLAIVLFCASLRDGSNWH